MRTIYEAEDGTQFDSETECAVYELQITQMCGFDYDGKEIYYDETFVGDAEIVWLGNQSAVDIFCRDCDRDNLARSAVTAPGIYYWADVNPHGAWIPLEPQMLENAVKLLEKME